MLSKDRILTTHVGSLPRGAAVVELLYKKENGEPHDTAIAAGVAAEQLCQYASIVGRERVIAGTDCGFGSFAGVSRVDAAIVYKKLAALAEGAALAAATLWKRART